MENQKTVYINFFNGIDLVVVNKFIQFTTEVMNVHKPTELYFIISSNGGDVDSGFVLYNFLVSLQAQVKITMHNSGTIDSIANVIFVAGQERYAAPNSSFLFHGVSMNMQGSFSRSVLKENLSRLEGMENRIAHTVSKHSKLTENELTELFHQGEGKDVNFALDKGIIQDIKSLSIPRNSIHLAMSFI